MTQKVLFLDGDGVGPFVINAAERVLSAIDESIEVVHGEIGRSAYDNTGLYMPHDTLDLIDECQTILCGPTIVPESGKDPVASLSVQLDLYARAREYRTLASDLGHGETDVILWGVNNNVAAEITEVPDLDGIAVTKHIRNNSYSRMMGVALNDVELRKFEKIGCITRDDFFPVSSGLFAESFDSMFPPYRYETRIMNVKQWSSETIRKPTWEQCILCVDLYSQVAASVLGGVTGFNHLAPKYFVGNEYILYKPCNRPMYEEMESRYVNPTSAIMSIAIILRKSGKIEEFEALVKAVKDAYAAGERTPDVGGTLSCSDFTDRVIGHL